MLAYLFLYILAAVMIFQGVNLLVERTAAARLVPPELRPGPLSASRWGTFLVSAGAILALAGLLSHRYEFLVPALMPLRNLGLAILAVYGLWLVFGRKVDYRPAAPGPDAHGHGH